MDESLDRFLQAQDHPTCFLGSYEDALSEIQDGKKRNCWMWYVFPILEGLGSSKMARRYGLHGVKEAEAYIHHPVLGKRLVEVTEALLHLDGLTAEQIFGATDAWKLQCCMTLFQTMAPEIKVFHEVLMRYYQGKTEQKTVQILEKGMGCEEKEPANKAQDNSQKRPEQKMYQYTKSGAWIPAHVPFQYSHCFDGISVHSGTLLGSGFVDFGKGIGLPVEIDGLPVTEFRGTVKCGELGHIEAPGGQLRRVFLRIEGYPIGGDEMYCSAPSIYGKPLDTMELEFCGSTMLLGNFSGCRGLRRVTFNGTVVDEMNWHCRVIDGGFTGCEKLESVTGRFEGDFLGDRTFADCTSLVAAPDLYVKRFGFEIFRNCRSLKQIHLKTGLTSIGDYAFSGCSSLEDIYIPDTVTYLGAHIFEDCVKLETIHLPPNLKEIPSAFLKNCALLRKCFLPDTLVKICDSAFEGCRSLSRPWIPNSLKEIGTRAFYNCVSLREVMIPRNVTSIGAEAFQGCPNVVIKCDKGSVAHQYAEREHINYILF